MEREKVLISKACKLVGVSRRTLYNWMRDGLVMYTQTESGTRYVYVDTLWRNPDGSEYPAATIPKADPARQPTLSIMKAKDEAGVTRRSIYNWIEKDKLEWLRTAGGNIRIVTESLWRAPQWPDERPGEAARAVANAHH